MDTFKKWVKRILFVIVMAFCTLCAIEFFFESEIQKSTLIYLLDVLVVVLAVVNCVLHFKFYEEKKWAAAIGLIVMIILQMVLVFKFDVNVHAIGVFGSVAGFLIHCGFKWIDFLLELLKS